MNLGDGALYGIANFDTANISYRGLEIRCGLPDTGNDSGLLIVDRNNAYFDDFPYGKRV